MRKNKKKIKIATLRSFLNYGNRLQNYALSSVLKKNGFMVKTSYRRTIKQSVYEFFIIRFFYKPKRIKEHRLNRFTRSRICRDYLNSKKAEYTIVGSDQVWNPDYLKKQPELLNVPDATKKVSYAASIGMEKLTPEQEKMFAEALMDYSAISVREQSAKELLQPLVPDKKIEVVLDPTLLLKKEDYEKLERCPKDLNPDDKYILCYILGGQEHKNTIEEFAKEKGYKTIYFSDKRESNYGVEEFLYFIHHAELVCTDSFHACVFSFIFETPFIAFKRTGEANYMYTRIQNLIRTFGFKNCEYDGKKITEQNLKSDFTEAKKILKKEQDKSINFLKNALSEKDK